MKYNIPDKVLKDIISIAEKCDIEKIILFGSRAKGTHKERSDIDIAVSGVVQFSALQEEIGNLPTLFSVDIVNLDTCTNPLLQEDIRNYGKKIYEKISVL